MIYLIRVISVISLIISVNPLIRLICDSDYLNYDFI